MTDEVMTPSTDGTAEVSSATAQKPKKGTPEFRQADAERKQKERAAKKRKSEAASNEYDSEVTADKKEAREILEARGLKRPHVIDTVYRFLTQAARDKQIPANKFLYRSGMIATLRSIDAKAPVEPEAIKEEPVTGELLTRLELHALYDASLAAYEPTTFEEFLQIRRTVKTDAFYLGKVIFENDFAQCHEVWREFFPRFNPDTLPAEYTQKQAINWLGQQSEIKDYLLLASRRAFKSSFARLWLLTLIVTYPDVRCLIVSETHPLAKDAIEAMRGYFEAQPGFETRFQRLFPEATILPGDGSVTNYEHPMRRLRLPQTTLESSSMDSTVAGKRADVILFDDPISEVSCTNDDQVAKSVRKRDMLVKLIERGGYKVTLGTPYGPTDLYYQQIERARKNADDVFACRIDPAFEVKPSAQWKLTPALAPTLLFEDIESFLFPEGLPWKELRVELMNNPTFFLSQNLCIFPRDEDAELKVHFDEDMFRQRTCPPSFFGAPIVSQSFLCIDRAFSTSIFADFSAICAAKVQAVQGKDAMVVTDVRLERWRESELIKNIGEMIEKHHPVAVVVEKDRNWQELWDGVKLYCLKRQIPVPHFHWRDIPTGGQSLRAKAKRVKSIEQPIADGRLWFVSGPWTDQIITQFTKFDPIKGSNSHRKDDLPDAISLGYSVYGPRYVTEVNQEDERQRELEAREERDRIMRQQAYDAMFSTPHNPLEVGSPAATPAPPKPTSRPGIPNILGPGFSV